MKLREDHGASLDAKNVDLTTAIAHLDKITGRHTRDIEELQVKMHSKPVAPVRAATNDAPKNQETAKPSGAAISQDMADRLEDLLAMADNFADKKQLNDLLERLAKVETAERADRVDIDELKAQVKSVMDELRAMDGPRLKRDVDHLNKEMHQLATKTELERVNSEMQRIRSMIADLRDDEDSLQTRLSKIELQFTSLDTYAREAIEELKKQVANLDGQIQALRKMLGRLSEKMETGGRNNISSNANLLAINKNSSDDGEFEKLKAAFEAHQTQSAKQNRDLLYSLDTKANKQDLIDLEARLRELIQEIVKGLPHGEDGNSAIKKKVSHLEKMVSPGSSHVVAQKGVRGDRPVAGVKTAGGRRHVHQEVRGPR